MELQELKSVLEEIKEKVDTPITPYEMIKIVNERFDLNLPTQMGYNYVRKGFVPAFVETDEKGKDHWFVNPEDVVTWITKYTIKNVLTITL